MEDLVARTHLTPSKEQSTGSAPAPHTGQLRGDKDSVVVASQIRSHGLRSTANFQVSSSCSV